MPPVIGTYPFPSEKRQNGEILSGIDTSPEHDVTCRRILDVKYHFMQLPRGKFKFAPVRILLIHGHAFITANIEGFMTGICSVNRCAISISPTFSSLMKNSTVEGPFSFGSFMVCFRVILISPWDFHIAVKIVPVQSERGIAVTQFAIHNKQCLSSDVLTHGIDNPLGSFIGS
jgi:hypothetical protein